MSVLSRPGFFFVPTKWTWRSHLARQLLQNWHIPPPPPPSAVTGCRCHKVRDVIFAGASQTKTQMLQYLSWNHTHLRRGRTPWLRACWLACLVLARWVALESFQRCHPGSATEVERRDSVFGTVVTLYSLIKNIVFEGWGQLNIWGGADYCVLGLNSYFEFLTGHEWEKTPESRGARPDCGACPDKAGHLLQGPPIHRAAWAATAREPAGGMGTMMWGLDLEKTREQNQLPANTQRTTEQS